MERLVRQRVRRTPNPGNAFGIRLGLGRVERSPRRINTGYMVAGCGERQSQPPGANPGQPPGLREFG
jgi:hypothetical protein